MCDIYKRFIMTTTSIQLRIEQLAGFFSKFRKEKGGLIPYKKITITNTNKYLYNKVRIDGCADSETLMN